MDDINDFLEHYQPKLLYYLEANPERSPNEPGPLEFVENVLDGWSDFAKGRQLREPSLRERTFWFALYQLEELVETPVTGKLDPYEEILMQNLAKVRNLLKEWHELPEGFHATRPGEDPCAL